MIAFIRLVIIGMASTYVHFPLKVYSISGIPLPEEETSREQQIATITLL